MARILTFSDVQLGDGVLKIRPLTQALTPPVERIGIWQDAAEVVCNERNLLYIIEVDVYLVRANTALTAEALHAIQALAGTSGNVLVVDGADQEIAASDWHLKQVGEPSMPDGFGGRLVERLTCVFCGGTAPTFGET